MRKDRRRKFLLASSALLAAPLIARAQAQQRLPVLGILNPFRKPAPEVFAKSPFSIRLRELGWIEGKTLLIERAYAEGDSERLPELAVSLVAKKVDVIYAATNEAIGSVARATRDIPIVMLFADHPVENGWVKSLARPGGNITGTMWADPEQASKALELLREAAPRAVRIAITFNPNYPFAKNWLDGYDRAARILGMTLQYFPIRRLEDIDSTLASVGAARPDALFVSLEAVQFAQIHKFVAFAIERKLMMVSNVGSVVDRGGMLAYEPDQAALAKRAASYVDRILRGARPADLPVELPALFALVINAKTARAIGYKIPPSLLARADRVIE